MFNGLGDGFGVDPGWIGGGLGVDPGWPVPHLVWDYAATILDFVHLFCNFRQKC